MAVTLSTWVFSAHKKYYFMVWYFINAPSKLTVSCLMNAELLFLKKQRHHLKINTFTTLDSFKGHGSGCKTALSVTHCHHYRVYCLTPPTSLCSDNTQNLHQINGGTDTKTVPTTKTKGQCAGNTPNTLILANRPRSDNGSLYSWGFAVSFVQLPQTQWVRS